MSELKMSDAFKLPVTMDIEVCTIKDISPIAFSAMLVNKNHVYHAINSHDKLVDTITEQDKVISERGFGYGIRIQRLGW